MKEVKEKKEKKKASCPVPAATLSEDVHVFPVVW